MFVQPAETAARITEQLSVMQKRFFFNIKALKIGIKSISKFFFVLKFFFQCFSANNN